MKELNHTSYYLHQFSSWNDMTFQPHDFLPEYEEQLPTRYNPNTQLWEVLKHGKWVTAS